MKLESQSIYSLKSAENHIPIRIRIITSKIVNIFYEIYCTLTFVCIKYNNSFIIQVVTTIHIQTLLKETCQVSKCSSHYIQCHRPNYCVLPPLFTVSQIFTVNNLSCWKLRWNICTIIKVRGLIFCIWFWIWLNQI